MTVSMRLFAWSIVALLAAAGPARAQARATITGTVAGPGGAAPPTVTLVLTNLATGIDRRAVSEPDGTFVFGGLVPATYRLRVDDDTFAPWSQDQIVLGPGAAVMVRVELASRVPVAAPPTQRSTVAGTVIGPDGRPLPDAVVIITNAQSGIDRRGVSEPSGAYVFGGLAPGGYRLRVEQQPGALPFTVSDLTLAPGEQRQLDIRLQPAPALAPVVAPPGAPPGRDQIRLPVDIRAEAPPPALVPEVSAPGGEFEALPDRWQFDWPEYRRYSPPERMPWVVGSPLDPYNQNAAKADYPIAGGNVFANLNLQVNSALNPRSVANLGAQDQFFYNNNLVAGLELFQGDTVFQPKNWAVRATAILNYNGTAQGSLSLADAKRRSKPGIEEAFVEKRLAVLNQAFDFVSIRGGMQNFNSDFRGYLFADNQLGVRLFGNAGSNRAQYNIAYFSMRNRDAFSQLHDFGKRNQDVIIANYYVQDFGGRGYTAMFNTHLNRDGGPEGDSNALQAIYLGFHGDGRWGSWGVSHAFYQVFGSDDANRLALALGRPGAVDINARMAAIELSRDADWKRYRFSAFYASGDSLDDPSTSGGFDAITDNPNLAGGQFMFWTQQSTTIAGLGSGELLSEKFSLLPNLRSKFTDRANFVNPGLILLNGGVDLRISPSLKFVTNASFLRFADATVLRALLGARPGFEDDAIGIDISAGAKFRPFVNENLFILSGFSLLMPSGGFKTAVGSDSRLYSVFGAIQIAY